MWQYRSSLVFFFIISLWNNNFYLGQENLFRNFYLTLKLATLLRQAGNTVTSIGISPTLKTKKLKWEKKRFTLVIYFDRPITGLGWRKHRVLPPRVDVRRRNDDRPLFKSRSHLQTKERLLLSESKEKKTIKKYLSIVHWLILIRPLFVRA